MDRLGDKLEPEFIVLEIWFILLCMNYLVSVILTKSGSNPTWTICSCDIL